jgi:hypothetical protein
MDTTQMAETPFKHGEMDIREQEKMFSAFVTWVMRTAVVVVAILAFLALFAS